MLRDFAILTAAGMLGNFVAEKWLLKATPDDPSGFVLIAPGLGMDDLLRAASFAVAAVVLHKIVPGR